MITVVMPYWARIEAARNTMLSFDRFYGDDVKVIIVDDGSPKKAASQLADEFERLTVVSLPVKEDVRNPCVPINRGAAIVDTEYIGLTNPETYHTGPSLYEMVDMIKDDKDYILAPVFCPETNEWHCHPNIHPDFVPQGTGFHHLSLMKKSLWNSTGGFDEDYRDGYCFDDTDFVMRLVKAGANFMYSTIPAMHVRTGARAGGSAERWQKNHDIFTRKWNSR